MVEKQCMTMPKNLAKKILKIQYRNNKSVPTQLVIPSPLNKNNSYKEGYDKFGRDQTFGLCSGYSTPTIYLHLQKRSLTYTSNTLHTMIRGQASNSSVGQDIGTFTKVVPSATGHKTYEPSLVLSAKGHKT